MKKILCLLSVFCFLPVTALAKEESLYKYVQNDIGVYGYDIHQPLYLYDGSKEQIKIPDTYTQEKEQFKSAWVATIANLNMGLPKSEADFKAQYMERINELKSWNMNAIIFQVRPLLDAYYPSEINPSSEFLTGKQGAELSYDPLTWMVDTAHENGLEYHAWLNPYRVSNQKLTSNIVLEKIGKTKEEAQALTIEEHIEAFHQAGLLADNNYAVLHPDYVLRFDEKLFLNPGIPEVIEHVQDTVAEIITNYDVDAIHFDDYFYPYRLSDTVYFGRSGEDRETFEKYGLANGYADTEAGLEEWRRDNITALIEGVKETIDQHNQKTGNSVQLGISPFGIWEHKANDSRGSNTPVGSSQSYSNSIYADTYKWIKEELVDYMAPQIYWSFGQAAAPYGELTKWWNDVAEGTHVQIYVGHANYKHVNNGGWDAEWMNPEEISHQMRFNQKFNNVKGSILFSYNDIVPSKVNELDAALKPKHEVKNQSIQLLKKESFSTPSLVPAKQWLSHGEVAAPQNAKLENQTIHWEDTSNKNARFYVVYAGNEGEKNEVIQSKAENIVARVAATDATSYSFDMSNQPKNEAKVKYVVSTLDKAQVESKATEISEQLELSAVPVYRAYNPNDGDHLYTISQKEYQQVIAAGWKDEGLAWNSVSTGKTVYRLYNPNSGEHFYTIDLDEYNNVAKKGWNKEGIGFYSEDSSTGEAIYRAFNPNATGPGSHLYTNHKQESDWLVSKGWKDEGIAFYGLK